MSSLSHSKGETDSALLAYTIPEALKLTLQQYGDHDALVSCHQGIHWNYRQLNEQVDQLAAGLLAAGLLKGDRRVSGRPTRPSGWSLSWRRLKSGLSLSPLILLIALRNWNTR